MAQEVHSLEKLLEENVSSEDALKNIKRLLFGPSAQKKLDIVESAAAIAKANNFELQAFKVDCPVEQIRPSRIVRIGAIQNQIVLPTTAPVKDQYEAIQNKLEKLIDAAGAMGVNVLGLQEAWTCPFFMCTREKMPWLELAEDAENGPSVQFIKRMAKKYNMVIVSSILERDSAHQDIIWNTCVVIGNHGNYIGKHRKNHIPRVGDFNESTYYMEGNTGHPVFVTAYGKIGINICYGRHHPLNWQMFGINGAEIVFNPSATVGGLSEPLWSIEARNAAIANSYFAVAINRVGTEVYPAEFTSGDGKPAHRDFGHFYGSSYVACPEGSRTPGLSRTLDGLLVVEVDLNMCRQTRDRWCFPMTARLDMYAQSLTKAVALDFKPQQIHDPSCR